MRAPPSGDKILKRTVLRKKDLMRELYACKECDCESYPWCTYLGGLCRECVDLTSYTHKRPLRSKPGEYSIDRSALSNENAENVEIDYPHVKIIPTPLDGDCLYAAISLAFDSKITVEQLRYLVARYQTPETFDTYKELASFMPEYRPVRATHSLRDFRVLIKKTGEDMGVNNCLWGDENALQIMATFLRLGIEIFNEKGQHVQSITPERTTTFNNTVPTRYVLLLLNSSKPANEHYNLLQFNRHTLLTKKEWEKMRNLISNSRSSSSSQNRRISRNVKNRYSSR